METSTCKVYKSFQKKKFFPITLVKSGKIKPQTKIHRPFKSFKSKKKRRDKLYDMRL